MAEKRKKRKDGRYARQVTVGIKDGKPIKKTVYGKTIKEVDQNYELLMNQLKTGIRLDLQKTTVKDLMQEWYKTTVFPNTKANTHRNYDYFFARVFPVLGEFKVSDIKKFHVEESLVEFRKRGDSSARETLMLLKKFFNYCVERDIIAKNPCLGLSVKYTPGEKRRLTKEELQKIEDCDLVAYDKAFLFTLRYTGMRIGELCALYVSDVDFENMQINISKTVTMVNNKPAIQENTKSAAGNRSLPILLPLYSPLKLYVARLPEGQELLFPSNVGKPQSNTGAGHLFKRIIRDCDIDAPEITPHYLRHNFISECYDAGIDIKKVQYWVGHSDIKTTLDIYTHLREESKTDGTEMNDFYGSQTEVKGEYSYLKKLL